MSKPKPRPGKLVTVRVTPAVAAKLEADARKAKAFNKGVDAAWAAASRLLNKHSGDALAYGVLLDVVRDIAALRKPTL